MTSKTIKKLKELYEGELVIFYLKELSVPIPTPEGEITVSASILGVVLDIDDSFYYVANPDTGLFSKTIAHDTVGLVELMMAENELLSFDSPASDSEVH